MTKRTTPNKLKFLVSYLKRAKGSGKLEVIMAGIRYLLGKPFYFDNEVIIENKEWGYAAVMPKRDTSVVCVDMLLNPNEDLMLGRMYGLLKRYSKKSRANYFIDIGANVGQYSLPLTAKLTKEGYNLKTYAVEPLEKLAKCLLKSSLLSKVCYNVVNIALSDECGNILLKVPTKEGVHFSIISTGGIIKYNKINFDKILRTVVPQTTLDKLLKDKGIPPERISLIKIDVEGAERLVIKGGLLSLKRTKAPIVFEAWSDYKLKGVIKELVKVGYKYFYKIDRCNYVAEK